MKKLRLRASSHKSKKIVKAFTEGHSIHLEGEYALESGYAWTAIFPGIIADLYKADLVITDKDTLQKISSYQIEFYYVDPNEMYDTPEVKFLTRIFQRQPI